MRLLERKVVLFQGRVDAVNVVMIVESSQKIGDLFARGFIERREVFGQIAQLGGDDGPASLLQGLGNGVEVLNLSDETDSFAAFWHFFVFERREFLRAGFDGVALGIAV